MNNTNNTKIVPFNWKYGEEMVSLHVNRYMDNDRLYIGMWNYEEDYPEPFCDMTVNLPGYRLDYDHAFINGDLGSDLVEFITEQGLGIICPEKGRSGYREYHLVKFNMEKLKEFDPKGVRNYLASMRVS